MISGIERSAVVEPEVVAARSPGADRPAGASGSAGVIGAFVSSLTTTTRIGKTTKTTPIPTHGIDTPAATASLAADTASRAGAARGEGSISRTNI
jgi:hypothetical protein